MEEVLLAARNILTQHPADNTQHRKNDFKRILVVRTDRIGDLLLSTPVIQALRQNYPDAYIAAMVSPYAKEIVEGNPYLDEVIIYDKDFKHKSWARSMKFASRLRKKRFDLALILHPTNRVHLITFFAGSYLGSLMAVNIPDNLLKKIFGIILMITSIRIIFWK